MNEIKCIFCAIDSNDVVIEENGYKGKRCPQCGLIYVSPRPSASEIIDLYGHDNAHVSSVSHISAFFSKRLYARHHLKIINRFVKTGMLLEIGAGAGYFLDEARKVGFAPHGIEFNPIQADYIRKTLNIPCEESPVSSAIFDGSKFDIVYHCDVISHFFDPFSDFKKINQVMKDDSFLIFETGNFSEINQRYFKYIQRFQLPDHLFFFSADNLTKLLKETGFELIKIYRYSILPQIITTRIVSSVKKKVREKSGKQIAKNEISTIDFGKIHLQEKTQQKLFQYITYILRYKLGSLTCKDHRPQTIIVIAKKKGRFS
jgi:2-polyprenyl-3-methyl-5-hydroxy-6-metoxy-1,4-benzoquinol methylase